MKNLDRASGRSSVFDERTDSVRAFSSVSKRLRPRKKRSHAVVCDFSLAPNVALSRASPVCALVVLHIYIF